MLSILSVEAHSNSRMLMKNHFLRSAVEMVLGRRIMAPPENTVACKNVKMSENFSYLQLIVAKLWMFKIAKVTIVSMPPDKG